MEFDESLQQYVYQYEDLIFSWDEEPKEQYLDKVKALAKNYRDNLERMIDFILPDLREMYGDISVDGYIALSEENYEPTGVHEA